MILLEVRNAILIIHACHHVEVNHLSDFSLLYFCISDLLCGSGMHILSVGPSSSSVAVSSDPLEQLMDEMAGVE